jgi:hypothetical protein
MSEKPEEDLSEPLFWRYLVAVLVVIIVFGIGLAIVELRYPELARALVAAVLCVAVCAYPAFFIGGLIYFDGIALLRGMAWKSRRTWQVRLCDEYIELSCDGRVPTLISLASIRSARYVFDDNFSDPMNLQDAIVLRTDRRKVKIPRSATGFSDLLTVLEQKVKLQRVAVQAFGQGNRVLPRLRREDLQEVVMVPAGALAGI